MARISETAANHYMTAAAQSVRPVFASQVGATFGKPVPVRANRKPAEPLGIISRFFAL